MGRSLLATSSTISNRSGPGDAFCFLAFNQDSGEVISYGHMAIFALARADLLEPTEAIEILNAGVAGRSLWLNQTPLSMARMVLDLLAAPWSWERPSGASRLMIN